MNTSDLSTGAQEPIWQRINRSVKAGQNHPKAGAFLDSMSQILGDRVPGVHAGMARIVHGLRESHTGVLHGVQSCRDLHISQIALASLFSERGWREYIRTGNDKPPFLSNITDAFDRVTSPKALESDTYGSAAWERLKYCTEHRNNLTPAEQFRSGVSGEIFLTTEFLKAAPYVVQKPDELAQIVSRSVPAILQSFANLDLQSFEMMRRMTSEHDPVIRGRRQNRAEFLNRNMVQLCNDANGKRILNFCEQVRSHIPQTIISLGCPAKYAKSLDGESMIVALASHLLSYWRSRIHPLLQSKQSESSFSIPSMTDYQHELHTVC